MQWRSKIGYILLTLLIISGLIYGFMPQPVLVDVAKVMQGPLAVTVEEEGKTRVMARYVISAPISGYVRRIDSKVGDAVQAGQTLARIEPMRSDALDPRSRAQAQAQVKAAEAAIAAAQDNARMAATAAELARDEWVRAESLRKSNFVSAQALDKARAEAKRSQAAQQAAEHAVNVARYEREVARAALKSTSSPGQGTVLNVLAPVDARVLKLAQISEGTVLSGQPLLEIGNPETLEVEVEVLSTHAVQIVPGAKVMLDRWGGGLTVQGVVRVVEPAGFTKVSALGVEEQRVRVIVDFATPREQWQRLGDAYRVEARFIIWEGADVLQVPASALFRHEQGWAVFKIEHGRAKRQPVEIGHRAGLQVQILSGLQQDALIISHPDDKVQDGVRVKRR